MPRYLVLPKIGMNMEDAVITNWLVKPGDMVKKEQMVVEAETDKAIQELFATDSGIVAKLLVNPGDVVKCQERIAVLVDEGEVYTEEAKPPAKAGPAEVETPKTAGAAPGAEAPATEKKEKSAAPDRIRISPLARKLAAENGVELKDLHPAEAGKRIVSADVKEYLTRKKAASAPAQPQPAAGSFVPYTRMRQIIARNMRESVASKPRVSLVSSVDCTKLIAWREELKKTRKVTYNELIAKACASALKKYPQLNCTAEAEGYAVSGEYNIGIAVDTPAGLKVPVLKNVDQKGVLQLAEEFAGVIERARDNTLRMEDISGGSFTISNLGMYAVESFDPIINGKECFILGVAAMKDTVVPIDGEIAIRKCMKISLVFDHSAFDGADAAKLLTEIKSLLENPLNMLA